MGSLILFLVIMKQMYYIGLRCMIKLTVKSSEL